MKYLLWVDLEMTGLDPAENRIIECAGIVTDLAFDQLATFHRIVYQPADVLAKMDDWNVRTHTESGLLNAIPGGTPLQHVEQELTTLVSRFWPEGMAVLAGNSIHQDRKFIDRYMPAFANLLHYRMIDVSAFKQVFKSLYHVEYQKENVHRALDDIRASIAELRYYLSFVRAPNVASSTDPPS